MTPQSIWESVLSSARGVSVGPLPQGQAVSLRQQLNRHRKADRARNATIYPDPDHPMHGRSGLDGWMISLQPTDDEGFVNLLIQRSAQVEVKEL